MICFTELHRYCVLFCVIVYYYSVSILDLQTYTYKVVELLMIKIKKENKSMQRGIKQSVHTQQHLVHTLYTFSHSKFTTHSVATRYIGDP